MQHKDQYGNTIHLPNLPQRIVSLVPSQTELLYELGLGERVVGITKFCISPEEWFRNKTRVGGPKKVKIDKVRALQPDLIIGNKEENIKSEIEELQEIAPVWLSDVFTLEDNYEMIRRIAAMCGATERGEEIIRQTKVNFSALQPLENPVKVLYLIWKKPFMAVASHTFIDYMLTEELGVENIIGDEERYPALDENDLPQPDVVFLSTEPYPFQEKHFAEVQPHFPNSKLMIVDGELFTWYGARLIKSAAYLKELQDELKKIE